MKICPPFARAIASVVLAVALTPGPGQAAPPDHPAPLGLGLGSFNYWTSGPFADTARSAGNWIEFAPGQWGSTVYLLNEDGTPNPQFNQRGLPNYLNGTSKLRLLLWPYGESGDNQPAAWPKRHLTGVGEWVVTWQGDADVRLEGATFLAAESNGPATGRITNGRRVYTASETQNAGHIVVHELANPLADLKVWLPDPANPATQSLENSNNLWHPAFLRNLNAYPFAYLRFMDWGSTNQSPQMDWSDRRLPGHVPQQGVLNRRPPATGFAGNRPTGVAWELMVALANETGKDLWICVPHMATDDYITRLARLVRYGSDGVNPYTTEQANPVFAPLHPNLKVWVEYSNEIWSNGNSFPQGNWAEAQAIALGYGAGNTGKSKFNARRSSQIWSIFQTIWGGDERIVRVGALWTSNSGYSDPYLTELRDYGPTLTPAVSPDIIAPTTYFGNGIQDWIHEQANLNRYRPTNRQWFHTSADFVHNTTTGATRPVSKPLSDPYWSSPELATHENLAFDEWKKRIFSGSSAAGGGPDSTGVNGGFDGNLRQTVQTIFGQTLPLIAYEGGPSLYTDYLDGGDERDDGITNFMIGFNRRPPMAEIYRIQLNMARAKGLTTHGMFVDIARAGKFGQWGHLEFMDQALESAPKWQACVEWAADLADIRNPSAPLGTVPSFATTGSLPDAQYQQAYQADILATGGDLAPGQTHRWKLIGSLLPAGLQVAPVPGDPARYRISGTPTQGGVAYAYLRISDDDGDAAWQVFSVRVNGGPDVLLDSRITGATTAASLPYTTTLALDTARVSWSGLDRGAANQNGGGSAIGTDGRGVRIDADTNAIRFAVSQGTTSQADSTLASAITDNEYFKFTVTPVTGQPLDLRNARVDFTWERTEYHSPRFLAVFTSIGGFTAGQQVYTLATTPGAGSMVTTSFYLPETAAYQNLTAPVEFRVLLYGSQYSHTARLHGIKLTRDLELASANGYSIWADGIDWHGRDNSPTGVVSPLGISNVLAYALDLDPFTTTPEGLPLATRAGEFIEFVHRRRTTAAGLAYVVTSSPDLTRESWTPLSPDGVNIIEEIADPNPDGDGSAVLIRTRVRVAGLDRMFLRLQVTWSETLA